ncbi:unnamed protein product [Symbiodinium necroappetens]|uniref:Uncharacterized protein n=1 Tax=Symbiodinium necroappetens TaxID=1628268 RepID=A0A813ALH4_9DINO|nr:unnamed protein product [Symbiodinium sp. CCMP2456]CAE7873356.1 unnamed protein product [Symbiodinium necroappetens]
MKGKGKVQDFSTAGAEHLKREEIQLKKKDIFPESPKFKDAVEGGIHKLSKEVRADASSQYSREVDRLFLAWLPEEGRNFMEAAEGLGSSQKAEVAWLKRRGYGYDEVEVDISQWIGEQANEVQGEADAAFTMEEVGWDAWAKQWLVSQPSVCPYA